MATSAASPPSTRNRLLATLPPPVLEAIRPGLEPVEIGLREVLQPAGSAVRHVFFLESGWASMLAYMEDGDAAEVGLVGREGMVGLPVLLDAESDDIEAIVQCPGMALRMEARRFTEALDAHPAFRSLLLRYALVHHSQVARTAACNGRHGIEQRLARWLLMGHDRADGDSYPMTHEFLSMMLGVRRAGVTVAAGLLQRAGFIRYGAGRMEITDRPGLESTACECYGIVRRLSEAHFGLAPGTKAPYRP
ncbi:Crp/Fnr family transcriptional regulator [Pararoseomonas indoligenes]|uniref:Crp/Fnr family transcriptional regulator n=1 Tax=Roseomonas indoligenes TaxID=2820811 RepID=A0A940S7V0_9PROT|nr:Crp/Fnr family transcriptional regulator [Pararoseomonas indoligenes]MBP0495434.1 Crp/Fnr family transcriptional regulator [Pararoseomonas indoligenes]